MLGRVLCRERRPREESGGGITNCEPRSSREGWRSHPGGKKIPAVDEKRADEGAAKRRSRERDEDTSVWQLRGRRLVTKETQEYFPFMTKDDGDQRKTRG